MEKYPILAGGMGHYITGLDINKIGEMATSYYNIDMSKYIYFFEYYENAMLEKLERERKQRGDQPLVEKLCKLRYNIQNTFKVRLHGNKYKNRNANG